MYRYIVAFVLCIVVVVVGCKALKKPDAVDAANTANEKKSRKDLVRDDVAEFLVKMADARIMDSQEGEQAVEKGTQTEIQDYGRLMIRDQAMLLTKIKKLAAQKRITLPDDISSEKQEGLHELTGKQGKEFDNKFMSMITIDHERDIREMKAAARIKDAEVRQFVSVNLPVIESHLAKIREIRNGIH